VNVIRVPRAELGASENAGNPAAIEPKTQCVVDSSATSEAGIAGTPVVWGAGHNVAN
jgi:hypothetical protein